jgi:Dynamin family
MQHSHLHLQAGKSSVINALLGGRFLEEGILPTTNEINVLKFAEHEGDAGTVQNADGFSVRCPTPGMLSMMQHWHKRIRERFRHAPFSWRIAALWPAHGTACQGRRACKRNHAQTFLAMLQVRRVGATLLRNVNVVDTPGTNVILERQQRLTEEYVPRADLVLFVVSADRPFTESEVEFLQYIR